MSNTKKRFNKPNLYENKSEQGQEEIGESGAKRKDERKRNMVINIVTITFLLFITPMGLLVMWLFSNWRTSIKIIITIAFILLMMFVYFITPTTNF